jgi:hypothetical protein
MRGFVKYRLAAVVALLFAALTFGLAGNSSATTQEPQQVSASTGDSWGHRPPSAAQREAERVTRKFLARSNAGDTAGIAALIAEDVKWDTLGTVFNGRTAVMEQLIIPYVVNVDAVYRTEAVHWDTYRLQVDYNYKSNTGEDLGLHYAYLIEDGLIQDVVEYINYVRS